MNPSVHALFETSTDRQSRKAAATTLNDMRARLNQPGMPVLRVHVQPKRQKGNVGPADIQRLRGTLAPGDQAIFMTTSAYTTRASEEATASGRSPLGLLDGHMIARLMIEHEIGVTAESISLPRFDADMLLASIANEQAQ